MSRETIIVNALTFARVPLIFLWCFLAVAHAMLGGVAFLVSALAALVASAVTDLLDGMLARRWNVVSRLGKMADPLMDKIFFMVSLPTLVWLAARSGERDAHTAALLALCILYLVRDTWVTFLRAVGAMFGADVGAKPLGKARTALSFPGVGWVYAYLAARGLVPAAWVSPWLATCCAVEALLAALTALSLVTYTLSYLPYVRMAVGGVEGSR